MDFGLVLRRPIETARLIRSWAGDFDKTFIDVTRSQRTRSMSIVNATALDNSGRVLWGEDGLPQGHNRHLSGKSGQRGVE